MTTAPVRVGVVGHVEWVDFALVDHLPAPGEIVHAADGFSASAGGGAVAAVQLRRLAGAAMFLTALGNDETGAAAGRQLREEHGLDLHAVIRDEPQRRVFTHVDSAGERTITVLGERIVPCARDPLPWPELAGLDAVYFTGGDADALRAARAARVLTATPRALATIREAGVELDALIGSANDPGEQVPGDLDPCPRVIVSTDGERGGRWRTAAGETGEWAAAELPGPPADAYGCGDSFAAAFTFALGGGRSLAEAAALGARCGAAVRSGRGPYGAMLGLSDLA